MFLRAFLLTLFTGTQVGPIQAQGNNDDRAWSYAVSIGTASAMREYLRAYPTGAHIEEAIRLLIALGEIGPVNASIRLGAPLIAPYTVPYVHLSGEVIELPPDPIPLY